MVRGALHEYDEGDGRTGDASGGGRRLRELCRHLFERHAESDGILCFPAEADDAGTGFPLILNLRTVALTCSCGIQCGINDFAFSDLTRPTYDRVAKIFSYLINFVRFRESQTSIIDEHFNKSETTKARIESLYGENQELEQRLQEMRSQQNSVEGQVKEKTKRNDDLKATLLELSMNQKRVADSFERVKAEKAKKQALLEEKTEKLLKTRHECEKLRPYVLQSPGTLQTSLTELSESLTRDKVHIGTMERRMRALQASIDTFNVVSNDVQGCIKMLEDISGELQKEDEEDSRAIRNREALTERGNTVKEVAQTEKLLQRQLSRWQERTEALRRSAREKAEQAQARMEELQAVQKQLREERAEKQRDMERRRIRIEQTEKKVISPTNYPWILCAGMFLTW